MADLDAYVIDATIPGPDGLFCFCPVELDDKGNVVDVIVGLNFLSSDPPAGGKFIGVVHADGQSACDQWCAENEDELRRLQSGAIS